MPTFAYRFDDGSAPPVVAGLPPIASHSSQIQYLFEKAPAPDSATLDPT